MEREEAAQSVSGGVVLVLVLVLVLVVGVKENPMVPPLTLEFIYLLGAGHHQCNQTTVSTPMSVGHCSSSCRSSQLISI